MKYRSSASERILDRFARRLMVDGDPAPGGGAPAPAPAAPAAGAVAAAPAAVVPDPAAPAAPAADAPKSLLDAPPEPPAPEPKVETPEEKAARLAAETPEQKTAREAEEATARADALKPYDALKLPEGMPTDQPAFVDFKNAALDLEIPTEKAQKLLDTVAPKIKEALEAPYNQWADTVVKWVGECKNDPDFGGADFEKNLAHASQFIDKFGGEKAKAVREALAFTGAGNNPAIVGLLVRAGKALGEGVPVPGKPAKVEPSTVAARAYPSMQPTS